MEEMKELLEEMTTWEKDAEIIYNLTKKHFPKKKNRKRRKKGKPNTRRNNERGD